MAGVGTIPIEGSQVYPSSTFLCSDIHYKSIEMAQENIENFVDNGNVFCMRGNVKKLYLSEDSVDVVVTDLPYGVRHSSHKKNLSLYKEMMEELSRITKSGATVVLYTTEVGIIHEILKEQASWKLLNSLGIDNSGQPAVAFVLKNLKI